MDENNKQQGGGRLRWWQQQETEASDSTASRWQAAPPSVEESAESTSPQAAHDPMDVGEALEAEAARRAANLKRHEEEGSVGVGSHMPSIRRMRWQLVAILLVISCIELALYAVHPNPLTFWIVAVMCAWFLLLYFHFVKSVSAKRVPGVGVSSVGISPGSFAYCGLLQWHEIESVERRRISGVPTIVIKPKEADRLILFRHLPSDAKIRRLRWFLRVFVGLRSDAVYIDESALPLPVDEFMSRVQTYLSTARPIATRAEN